MGFAQLHHTAHEASGHAGRRFTAVTPGVDERARWEVGRFAVYEPPRGTRAGRGAEHPVNLCYAPDLGGFAVVSRVTSGAGRSPGGPGVFAHSLVSVREGGDPGVGARGEGARAEAPGEDAAEDDRPLPAELWDADFWASAPGRETALPALRPSRGPLDRARTDAWLRSRPPEEVARLLVCADAAVHHALPLLLVADSPAVALWVAALTHLMSPERARLLSFATYRGDLDQAPVHVVGVPPGSDTTPWASRFTVYDPAADSPETLPAPGAGARAVALRLARSGARGAPGLWDGARPYASGRERRLGDWRPVMAAAELLGDDSPGTGPGPDDLRAVRTWLPEAVEWLAPADTAVLLTRVLDACAESSSDDALADLRRVAHRVGEEEAVERVERVLVHRALDGIAAGGVAPRIAPMRSEAVREAARERIFALLFGLHTPGRGGGAAKAPGTAPAAGGPKRPGAPPERAVAGGGEAGAGDGPAGRTGADAARRARADSGRARAGAGSPPARSGVAPDRAVELLRWARAGDLVPSAVHLERYGGEVVAPLLAEAAHGRHAVDGHQGPASGSTPPAPEGPGEAGPGRAGRLRQASSGPAGPTARSVARALGSAAARVPRARAATAGPTAADPAVAALLADHHDVRRGAAAWLSGLPRDRLAPVAAGPIGALFAEDRDGPSALLRELRRLGTDDRADPVALLAYVVAARREGRAAKAPGLAEHDLDEALLTEVWGAGPGPRTALLAVRAMRPGVLVSPGVGGWVAGAMVAAPGAQEERAWRDLVDEVSRHWLRDRLPSCGQRVLVEWSEVRPSLARLRRAGEEHGPDRLPAVHRAVREAHPAVAAVARLLVVRVLSGWRRPATLAAALRHCPDDVFEDYCAAVAARLVGERPDTATAAVVYLVAGHEALAGHERARRLDSSVLSPAVVAWRRRHLVGLRRHLPREVASGFDAWARRLDEERERGRPGPGLWGARRP